MCTVSSVTEWEGREPWRRGAPGRWCGHCALTSEGISAGVTKWICFYKHGSLYKIGPHLKFLWLSASCTSSSSPNHPQLISMYRGVTVVASSPGAEHTRLFRHGLSMACMWKWPPEDHALNVWSPDGGSTVERCGNFRRCGFTGCSRSRGVTLKVVTQP